MLKYSKFLFTNILTKKSFWITLIISLLTITILGVLEIKNDNLHKRSVVTAITTYNKFLPFLFTTLLSSLLVLYIFKNGERDGSELLIISKPLYRWQIVAGKFFVLIVMIVMIELIFFIDTFSYVQTDVYGLQSERFRFAGSLAIGGLIIQLIISSFLVLIALITGRVALLTIGVVGGAIIPISSMIIAPISGGTPRIRLGEVSAKMDHRIVVTSEINKLVDDIYSTKGNLPSKPTDEEYEKYLDKLKIKVRRTSQDKPFLVVSTDPNRIKDAKKYNDELWYDKAMYGDMWFQWSGFYDIIMGENYIDGNKIQRWYQTQKIVDFDKKYSFDPADKITLGDGTKLSDIFITTNIGSLNNENFNIEKILNVVKRANDPNEEIYKIFHNASYNDGTRDVDSFEERLERIKALLSNHDYDRTNYTTWVTLKLIVKQMGNNYVPVKFLWRHRDLNDNKDMSWYSKRDGMIFKRGDKIAIWAFKPFVKRSTKVYIWTSIAIALMFSTIYIYSKRDFK